MNNQGPDKLYVAVRADLAPGPQIAQAVHAAFEFATEWPSITQVWTNNSNFLVVVAVSDEDALVHLAAAAAEEGLAFTSVREPDYNNTLTAVALEPGDQASKLCAQFPLAGKQVALVT